MKEKAELHYDVIICHGERPLCLGRVKADGDCWIVAMLRQMGDVAGTKTKWDDNGRIIVGSESSLQVEIRTLKEKLINEILCHPTILTSFSTETINNEMEEFHPNTKGKKLYSMVEAMEFEDIFTKPRYDTVNKLIGHGLPRDAALTLASVFGGDYKGALKQYHTQLNYCAQAWDPPPARMATRGSSKEQ